MAGIVPPHLFRITHHQARLSWLAKSLGLPLGSLWNAPCGPQDHSKHRAEALWQRDPGVAHQLHERHFHGQAQTACQFCRLAVSGSLLVRRWPPLAFRKAAHQTHVVELVRSCKNTDASGWFHQDAQTIDRARRIVNLVSAPDAQPLAEWWSCQRCWEQRLPRWTFKPTRAAPVRMPMRQH